MRKKECVRNTVFHAVFYGQRVTEEMPKRDGPIVLLLGSDVCDGELRASAERRQGELSIRVSAEAGDGVSGHAEARFSLAVSFLMSRSATPDHCEPCQLRVRSLQLFHYPGIEYCLYSCCEVKEKVDLFLDGLEEEDEQMKEFAIGGICNCICGTHRVVA